jgi:hypothetical protein
LRSVQCTIYKKKVANIIIYNEFALLNKKMMNTLKGKKWAKDKNRNIHKLANTQRDDKPWKKMVIFSNNQRVNIMKLLFHFVSGTNKEKSYPKLAEHSKTTYLMYSFSGNADWYSFSKSNLVIFFSADNGIQRLMYVRQALAKISKAKGVYNSLVSVSSCRQLLYRATVHKE